MQFLEHSDTQPYGRVPESAFAIETDAQDGDVLNLLVSPSGSRVPPTVVWTRRFDSIPDRDAVVKALHSELEINFLGRLTMIFGSVELDRITDKIVAHADDARRAAVEAAAETARKHQIVELYVPDTKRGAALELQRKSRSKADWSVVYDRALERDRLCDWLRWQEPRFLEFLAYAAEHGDEALTRLLTNEMFETERRVKKEGRGAGGSRPLKMWRGD